MITPAPRPLASALALVACLAAVPASAYEQAYPPTAPGAIEVKVVPPTQALQAEGQGAYFASNDDLFGSLFRYIRDNDVSMTTPVEADVVDTPRMRFFVGEKDGAKALGSQDDVTVVSLPERRVAAVGLRGSYSRDRFEEGRAKLDEWLAAHPEWIAAGQPYAVYWNGPFTPWFAKRSEVHVPVTPAPAAETREAGAAE